MLASYVREREDQWLCDLPGTMNALINYLIDENNGIEVYEKRRFPDPVTKKPMHVMSNGFTYTTDGDNKWIMVQPD